MTEKQERAAFAQQVKDMRELVSFPGATIWETIDHIGMTVEELTDKLGEYPETVQGLLQGSEPITVVRAFNLEKILGIDRTFWLRREQLYQQNLALLKRYESQLPPREGGI